MHINDVLLLKAEHFYLYIGTVIAYKTSVFEIHCSF